MNKALTDDKITIEIIMSDIEATAAKMSDARAPISHEMGTLNAERLLSLQDETRGYARTLIRKKDSTANKYIITSRNGVLGSIDVFIKRAIRKMTLWLIEPPWEEQKKFNNALTSSLVRMIEINEELMKGIAYLSKELDDMKKR